MAVSLAWVDMGYATYGLMIEHGKVIHAPPIAAWMRGKDYEEVKKWIIKKKGKIRDNVG